MYHLDEEHTKALRETLQAERQRLRTEIRDELTAADSEHYADLAGQVHDAGDESVADLLADANITIVSRLIGELREAEAALDRMGEGTYGLCQDCGEEIAPERLDAYPTARRCIEHQRRYEQTHMESSPRL